MGHVLPGVMRALHEGVVALPPSIGGSVPPLPKPPALEALLLETPGPAVIGIGVIALVTFFTMRAQGRMGRGALIGGVIALVGAGLMALAAVVETPREAMARRTRELVRAAATVDIPVLQELLAPDARLVADRFRMVAGMNGASRDEIITGVQQTLDGRYKVEDWAVLKMQARRDGPNAGRTQTQVRVNAGGVNFSWWKIDWRLEDDGEWRVIGIEPLFISGLSG